MSSAITIAAVGVGVSAYGAYSSSQAAGKAGAAQGEAADAFAAHQREEEQKALAGMQTPGQLAAYDKALQSQTAQVNRLNALASSLDPALVEAGKQTKALLDGKSAPVLGEIQNQRAVQRQQLQNDLTAKYGASAMSSGLGIQQLQKFDLDTSNMMNSVQQQYLGQVSNIALNGSASINDAMTKANQTLSTIQTQSPGEEAAKIMASFQSGNAAAGEAQVNAAGGKYAGDEVLGQGLVGLGAGVTTLGGAVAGYNRTNPDSTGGNNESEGQLSPEAQAMLHPKQPSNVPGGVSQAGQNILAGNGGPTTLQQAMPRQSAGVGIPSQNYNIPSSLQPNAGGFYPQRPVNLGEAFSAGTSIPGYQQAGGQ